MSRIGPLLRHPLFWGGILIKVVLSLLTHSKVTDQFFAPFLRYFVDTFQNPYQAYLLTQPDSFPYPLAMLGLFGGTVKLFCFFPTALAMKCLVLLADFFILLILLEWRPQQRFWVLILYWLSPVLLYINYIHGQLDVVPVSLLFFSLYYLFRNNTLVSTLFLGLSLAAKTSMVLVVPFYLVFLLYYHDGGILRAIGAFLLLLVLFFFFNLPYLGDPAFIHMVFLNRTQSEILSLKIFTENGPRFIIALGCYVFLLFLQFQIRVQTRTLFVLFCGFAFGAIVIFVPPMPGWYFWFLPFAVYFFASSSSHEKLLFFILQTAFLIYFSLVPGSDFFYAVQDGFPGISSESNIYIWLSTKGLPAELARDGAYTLLQTILLITVFWLFRRGVEHFGGYAFLSRPLLFGVGGNSGAGKSSFARCIKLLFGEVSVTDVKGDDAHRWERGAREWATLTHLDPKANYLHEEYQYLHSLKTGRRILRRHYDHQTGQFREPDGVTVGRSLIIYDGLHPFYLRKLRELFDIKVFLSPDEDLALHWKLLRDQGERGYSKEQTLALIHQRREDSRRFIEPQKEFADVVVSYRLAEPLTDLGRQTLMPLIDLELFCPNSLELDRFLSLCADQGLVVSHRYAENDSQVLRVDHGTVDSEQVVEALKILDITDWGLSLNGVLPGLEGFLQLFFAYYFLELIRHANARHP